MTLSSDEFVRHVQAERAAGRDGTLMVPLSVRLLDDQLTPVLAYRRLVAPDERTAPSFLLESVENGERIGRHSILGAQPSMEVVAYRERVRVTDHRGVRRSGEASSVSETAMEDPLQVPRKISEGWRLSKPAGAAFPDCFLGGWVGYAGYDTVRYAEPSKLGWEGAPEDDRALPDLHFAFYDGVVVFDHVERVLHVLRLVEVGAELDEAGLRALHADAVDALERRVAALQETSRVIESGRVDGADALAGGALELASNTTRQEHASMVARALEYIRAGDIFQVVVGQRFERVSKADPFHVYRALRAVNPSPYMVYLQAEGCLLVASSPEILCRVRSREDGRLVVTNRPLAGTRKRGATVDEDRRLEAELLSDPKERAEHVMLVDLGRNDVGKVSEPTTVSLDRVMEVERYSHVMHISSTVTGVLREGLDAWDALRSTLPVGTISGAPKIRAMQIIDELEKARRGPYGGGMGYVGLDGNMDIALALRTMVVPTGGGAGGGGGWTYHVQAAGGIVLDSKAEPEFAETVNKASALARAIEVGERVFA